MASYVVVYYNKSTNDEETGGEIEGGKYVKSREPRTGRLEVITKLNKKSQAEGSETGMN